MDSATDYLFLMITCIIIGLGMFIIAFGIYGFIYGHPLKLNETNYCSAPHTKAEYLCSTEYLKDKLSPPIDIRDDATPWLQ